MRGLPETEALARSVSMVTETMCGAAFVPGDPGERGASICGRMAIQSFGPSPQVDVVLAFDTLGSRALAAALFQCPPDALTSADIDDAVRELLNMIASQVRSSMGFDGPLGLPRSTTLAELAGIGGRHVDDAILLRSTGRIDLKLWIFEEAAPGTAELSTPRPQAASESRLGRLWRRRYRGRAAGT